MKKKSIEEELTIKIESMANKLRLLELEYLSQEREIQAFLEDEGAAIEKIKESLDKDSPETTEWLQAIEDEETNLQNELNEKLAALPDPELLKKKYAERKIDPRWIFVR